MSSVPLSVSEEVRSLQAQLREAQSRLQAVADTSGALLGKLEFECCEADGLVFVGADAMADQLLGKVCGSFLGQPFLALFPGLHVTDIPAALCSVAQKGGVLEPRSLLGEGILSGKSFSFFAFQLLPGRVVVKFWDSAGAVESNQRSLRSQQQLAVIFSQSPQAISLTRERDGAYVDVNAEWSTLTGLSLQDVIGRTSVDIGFWTDVACRDAAVAPMRASGRLRDVDLTFNRPDGKALTLQLNAMRIEIGDSRYFLSYLKDVTSEREVQAALLASEQLLHSTNQRLAQQIKLFESMESLASVGYWTSGADPASLRWSNGMYCLTGLEPGSVLDRAAGRSGIHADDRQRFQVARTRVDGAVDQFRWLHRDGRVHWLRSRMQHLSGEGADAIDFGVVQDITVERETALALEERLGFIQKITSRAPGVVFQFRLKADGSYEFPYISEPVHALYRGVSPEDLANDPDCAMTLHHPDDRERFVASIRTSARDLSPWSHEYRLLFEDGEVRWLQGQAMPERTADGAVLWHGFITDITLRKLAEEEVERLAFYDVLTGLPNRRLLLDRLQHAMLTSDRDRSPGALLFIDLDNFKDINDTQGHDMGDQLLQQVAIRLGACVREADTVARFGGDEFVVILERLGQEPNEAAAQAEGVGRKILTALNQAYSLGALEHHSTPSIGITLFYDHRVSVDELLKRADLAMYQAKAAGRNTLRFFDPEMQAVVAARAVMEAELRLGLQRKELLLHYQPVVNEDGQIVGVEALVRWQHPRCGLVMPGDFIALAEQTGLIVPLGLWVLEAACAQLVAWSGQPHTALLSIAVNVSVGQFRVSDFVDQLLTLLQRSGANPCCLKLEITESLMLNDMEEAIQKMNQLRAVGVRFSLDDFGTGYSSLAYLKRLPLEQLKIDQSFVRDVLTNPNDAAIAQTVLTLGQSLGLTVVAEGVETQAQFGFLMGHGCRVFQGYFFGRPVPIDQLRLDAPCLSSLPGAGVV